MAFAAERAHAPAPPQGPDLRHAVQSFAHSFSIELTPKQAAKVEDFAALLPVGTAVFITFLPGETVDAVISTVVRLHAAGMRPVPHVAARNLRSHATFEHLVRGSFAAGARELLVIAGGSPTPAGPFSNSLELLQTGLFETVGFARIFVAGHPEGNPDIPPQELERALAFKQGWSARTGVPVEVVTQFCFDAERVVAWVQSLRRKGLVLPVRVGVPGPASLTSLLKYAKMCGVFASLTFLQKSSGRMLQLLGHATPDSLILRLAEAVAVDRSCDLSGLHYYPFGGFAATAAWARAVAEGRFQLHSDGRSFAVLD